MFAIYDGRECFYQWDIDRKLIVKDNSINEVHFCNKTDSCSLVCEVYDEDGLRLVNVPNILLQTDWRINVYGYDAQYTKHSDCFKVVGRTKPADYIYTETEVLNYRHLEDEIYDIKTDLTTHPTYSDLYDEVKASLESAIGIHDLASKGDVGAIVEENIADAIEGYGLATKSEVESLVESLVADATQEKQYELMQTFTLTEATKTIELDGWELDKYVVFITSPKSDVDGGCSYQVFKGDKCVYSGWINQIISKADKGTSMLTGENKNGMAFIAAYTSNYSYKSPWITPKYIEGINPFTKIKLVVNTSSNYDFQVGAKIELWGVKR
jgi:hypothetical protein